MNNCRSSSKIDTLAAIVKKAAKQESPMKEKDCRTCRSRRERMKSVRAVLWHFLPEGKIVEWKEERT